MKTTTVKKAMMLILAVALIPMLGFSQDDDQEKLAQKASLSLTESMSEALDLADNQKDAVALCNSFYTSTLFTSDPLTDDVIKTAETTLDKCLKEVLDENQYNTWTQNSKTWLDDVKNSIPEKESKQENQQEEQTEEKTLEDILF